MPFELTIPDDYSLEETGITQSMLGNWMTCPRRFLYGVNRWTNSRRSSKTTSVGTMFHDTLDALYSQRVEPGDVKGIEKTIRASGQKIEGLEVIDRELFGATAYALLTEYVKFYKKDFTDFRFEEVERTFEVQFNGVTLRGKKDGIFRDKNKKRWLMEHKTKSRINEESLTLRLSIDLQNLFYLLADSIDNPKEPAIGCLYNVVRVPDVKKFTDPAQIVPYIQGLIKKDPKYYFMRYEVAYTKKAIDGFKKQLQVILNNLQLSCEGGTEMEFYRNSAACDMPFTCNFLNACSTGSLADYSQRPELFPELKP
jgi:hypothetical protein